MVEFKQLDLHCLDIDADFGKSHRIITDKILPDLERYGEASKGIWEGLKVSCNSPHISAVYCLRGPLPNFHLVVLARIFRVFGER
jgi:hypothetical protein